MDRRKLIRHTGIGAAAAAVLATPALAQTATAMPELKWRHGYAFVMLLMLLIATVQAWWLWRRGWFQDWTGQG